MPSAGNSICWCPDIRRIPALLSRASRQENFRARPGSPPPPRHYLERLGNVFAEFRQQRGQRSADDDAVAQQVFGEQSPADRNTALNR